MRKLLWAQITLAGSLTLLSACASGTLPDYNVLGALRVLALKIDTPEVDPTSGPTVNITPVVSDVNLGRSLTFTWTACVDPGVGFGATPSCSGVPGATTPTSPAAITLTPANNTSTGATPSIAVVVPSTLLASRNAIDSFNGVAYLFIYTLIAANPDGSTSQVVSFKRIIASEPSKTPKNTNPSITAVDAGVPLLSAYLTALTFPVPGGTTVALTPTFSPNSVETYTQDSGSPGSPTQSSLTEQLTTTWFVSDGTTDFYRTNFMDADTWTPPTSQPTNTAGANRGIVVVAVTRDGRGGEDFMVIPSL